MNNLEYPENKVWYILVRDLEIMSYGSIESTQVLSTVAEIAIYETEEAWSVALSYNGIEIEIEENGI